MNATTAHAESKEPRRAACCGANGGAGITQATRDTSRRDASAWSREMKTPTSDNAGGACNRRRLFSVNGGLVHRIGETPTRAAIQFNRQINGDALPVIQAGKKPPPRNANNAATASIIVWRCSSGRLFRQKSRYRLFCHKILHLKSNETIMLRRLPATALF
jgi:hypothetical protein